MTHRFLADENVGKLAKRLRMIGYDAVSINGLDDNEVVRIALKEGRALLTKDNGIMRRRVVFNGKIKAIFIEADDVKAQLRQVVEALDLKPDSNPFSRCMECNEPLVPRTREEVRELVPPYVFKNHAQYMQCPKCGRIYWRGTHWQRMNNELARLMER